MKTIIILLVFVSLSCGKFKENENEEKTNNIGKVENKFSKEMKYTVYDKYIEFYDTSIIDHCKFEIYNRENSNDYSYYERKECLFENKQGNPIFLKDIVDDIAITDSGTSPDPHGLSFFNLKTKKELLKENFDYIESDYLISKYEFKLLKWIGKQITEKQKEIVDYQKLKAAEEEIQKGYANSGIGYYEQYTYNIKTNELKSLNRIIPIVLQ